MPFANQSQAKRHCWTGCGSVLTKSCSLYAPGHKRGQEFQQLADCFGSAVFRADLPELAGWSAPQGVIHQLNNWQQQRLGLNILGFG